MPKGEAKNIPIQDRSQEQKACARMLLKNTVKRS